MAELNPDVAHAMSSVGHLMGTCLESEYNAVRLPGSTAMGISQHDVEAITEGVMIAIAEALQVWIDAGSEREAVMENESLRAAIQAEVHGWSDDPVNAPA